MLLNLPWWLVYFSPLDMNAWLRCRQTEGLHQLGLGETVSDFHPLQQAKCLGMDRCRTEGCSCHEHLFLHGRPRLKCGRCHCKQQWFRLIFVARKRTSTRGRDVRQSLWMSSSALNLSSVSAQAGQVRQPLARKDRSLGWAQGVRRHWCGVGVQKAFHGTRDEAHICVLQMQRRVPDGDTVWVGKWEVGTGSEKWTRAWEGCSCGHPGHRLQGAAARCSAGEMVLGTSGTDPAAIRKDAAKGGQDPGSAGLRQGIASAASQSQLAIQGSTSWWRNRHHLLYRGLLHRPIAEALGHAG